MPHVLSFAAYLLRNLLSHIFESLLVHVMVFKSSFITQWFIHFTCSIVFSEVRVFPTAYCSARTLFVMTSYLPLNTSMIS